MKDLEKSVGIHRVLEGKGKSDPERGTGTFIIPLGGARYCGGRWAVCRVSISPLKGWQILDICIHYKIKRSSPWKKKRKPTPSEVQKLIPLFFFPQEVVFEIHQPMALLNSVRLHCTWFDQISISNVPKIKVDKNTVILE